MTTKYEQISSSLFCKNRKIHRKNAAKIFGDFNSNDIYPVSSDSTMPFAQHRDIFYLMSRSGRKYFLIFQMLTEKNIERFFS